MALSISSSRGYRLPTMVTMMTGVLLMIITNLWTINHPNIFLSSYSGNNNGANNMKDDNSSCNCNGNNEDFTDVPNTDVNNPYPFRLRYDWTKLRPLSSLAKNISRHQSQLCSLPLGYHKHRSRAGIGSNLHVWSQAVCVGMERGFRIWTITPWNAIDEELCNIDDMRSSMQCYFPQSELSCPEDVPVNHQHAIQRNEVDPENPVPSDLSDRETRWAYSLLSRCKGVMDQYGAAEFRAGAMEYLFSPVSKVLQDEAHRQLEILFGKNGKVPSNLVTVHIRWGDKFYETTLEPIETYIQSVATLINGRLSSDGTRSAIPVDSSNKTQVKDQNEQHHIYVASEDPKAIVEFRNAAPTNWIIYEDVYLQMYQTERTAMGLQMNNHVNISNNFKGRPALVSIASLLVSLQANEYVLSTSSNWGRLINELRKNILDARCNKCTKLIEVGKPFEWR